MRMTTQQGSPLPFRHASPDAELDPVVQGVGEAFVADRAAAADPLRHVLLGALHEQCVRVATLTRRHAGPVADHPHLYTSPLALPPLTSAPHMSPKPCRRRATARRTIMLCSRAITQRCPSKTNSPEASGKGHEATGHFAEGGCAARPRGRRINLGEARRCR